MSRSTVCKRAFNTSNRSTDRAAQIIQRLLSFGAIDDIARKAGTQPGALRRLTQPSRRPKSIAADLFDRLRGVYLAGLRRQLAALETEIVACEALGRDDAAAASLVERAEAVAAEARALLKPMF